MVEPVSSTSSLLALIKPLLLVSKKLWYLLRHQDAKKVLERRLKWEPLIRDEISNNHKKNLGHDAIVHDMSRFFEYPDLNESYYEKIRGFLFGNRISS